MTDTAVELTTIERETRLRLRRVYPLLGPRRFAAMVAEIAAIQYKFERCEDLSAAPRSPRDSSCISE